MVAVQTFRAFPARAQPAILRGRGERPLSESQVQVCHYWPAGTDLHIFQGQHHEWRCPSRHWVPRVTIMPNLPNVGIFFNEEFPLSLC